MRNKYAKCKAIEITQLLQFEEGSSPVTVLQLKSMAANPGALSRRIRGLTKSKKEANSFWHQCLTNEQEEILIARINNLTDRGMPPTSHIIKNLSEEIRGKPIGMNWVGQFVKRHEIRLKSLYLQNIDNLRAGAEYTSMFQLFFSIVSCFS